MEATHTDRIQSLIVPQIEALAKALPDFLDSAGLERWLVGKYVVDSRF